MTCKAPLQAVRILCSEHPCRSTACAGSESLCHNCAGRVSCLWHGTPGATRHPGHQQLLQHLLPATRQVLARLSGVILVLPPAHPVCNVDDGTSATQHSVQADAAHAAGPCRHVHAQNICRYAMLTSLDNILVNGANNYLDLSFRLFVICVFELSLPRQWYNNYVQNGADSDTGPTC